MIQNLNYGGMERVLASIVQRIDTIHFESHILVLQYLGRFSDGLDHYATLHEVSGVSKLSMLRPQRIAQRIREISPDVVHSHSGVWYKASLAARMAGVPRVIHTDHGRQHPDPWQARFLDGLASKRTDVAVAVSNTVADQLQRNVVHSSCRIEVVANGIEIRSTPERSDVAHLRSRLSPSQETPIIGSVGRLEPIKNYSLMIEAFAILLNRWSGDTAPVLVIAGDGSERQRLERAALASGTAANVRFLGWFEDVDTLLATFTIFTMSSSSEGTSMSLLEAMSAGCCPVVTDVGGNGAVLGERLRHRLVPPADATALAGAWYEALMDSKRRKMDAAAARHRAVAEYSVDKMVDRYSRIYENRVPLGR